MKKTILFAFVAFMMVALKAGSQTISVFLCDDDGSYTNIRNAPNGKIVSKISTSKEAIFELKTPKDGWWRIEGDEYELVGDDDEVVRLKGSKTGYWIHNSCVGYGTRNYGGQSIQLRATPSSKGKVVYTFTEELIVHPIDVKGSWVKVKTDDGKHTGWIDSFWLCSNPLTNCC